MAVPDDRHETYARHKEMIEERLKSDGLTADEWRVGDSNRPEAVFKNTWEAIEDLDHGMVSEGEEGTLHAGVVGAPEYGNERVVYQFTAEGSDVPVECVPFENVGSL